MIALASHRKLQRFRIAGRIVLALTIVLTALANIATGLLNVPWSFASFMEPLFDLTGSSWESEGIVVSGALLLLVARALVRGKRHAWWLSVGLFAFSLLCAIFSRSDRSATLSALGLLILLLLLAPLFPTLSDVRSLMRGYAALVLAGSSMAAYWIMNHFWHPDVPLSFPALRYWLFVLLHVLIFLIIAYGVIAVLRPVQRVRGGFQHERTRVRAVMHRYGSLATIHFALGMDKSYFWSQTGQTVIAYRLVHGVALALGDPVGPAEEREVIVREFLTFCQRQDWPVAFYQASSAMQQLCRTYGMRAYKIGEEARITIADFTLQGKIGAPVRHAQARARRSGLTVQCWQGQQVPPAIFAGMKEISADWLDKRDVRGQMGFSMGRFPADWSPDLLTVAALGVKGNVQAFLTWTPLYAGNGWALDIMRRGNDTSPGAIELLIASAIEWAKARGYTSMSLGLSPLADSGSEAIDKLPNPAMRLYQDYQPSPSSFLERSAAFLHQRGILLGNYRSLYFFKAKFQPTWETRYLITGQGQAVSQILLALAKAHGNGWLSIFTDTLLHTIHILKKGVAQWLSGLSASRLYQLLFRRTPQ